MKDLLLPKTVLILLLFFLVFGGLYFAKGFLIPVAFGAIFSMLLLPLSNKLQRRGVNKALACIICIFLLIAVAAGIIALITWQITDLAGDADKIQQKVAKTAEQVKEYVSSSLGIPKEKQQQMIEKQQQSSPGKMSAAITGILSSTAGILANTVLVLVYIFLFMYFSTHLKNFVLKLVPQANKKTALKTIEDSRTVAQKYLSGLGMMIACLWIMYGIGFSVVGVKNALFFAVLCGLLETVPFVGNITGTALTVIMALVQGGSGSMILGILVTYALVQFIQTYLLEPLVVGAEVSINPLFTIIIIVIGEMVWGIPGMILAIPLLGIVKIICDNVEPLKPYAYLIGENKKKEESGIIKAIKGWFR